MRTIVAFILASFVASAQNPADLERAEKIIADHPDVAQHRVNLLSPLLNPGIALPPEKLRDTRRRHILWLIEHHPEIPNFAEPALLLAGRGRLADPAGSAEAIGLWKAIASDTSAKPEAVANAAIYLRALDIRAALAILAGRPETPVFSRARGMVDAAAVIGLSGLGRGAQFGTSAALRSAPEAKAALAEIESSTNPALLGNAGLVFTSVGAQIEAPFDLTFGDDEPVALAEKWLRHAVQLDPAAAEWKAALGRALLTKSNRVSDPSQKVRLLREADLLTTDTVTGPRVLSSLVLAEFDAGEDQAAERDSRRLLDGPKTDANAFSIAQTVLGRTAAAAGDLNGAKAHLMASITMPPSIKNASFQPNMTLAQDLYDAGEKDAVIQFLEASRAVWKFDRGRIDRMISFVKKAPSADLIQLSNQFPGAEVRGRPAPAFEAKDLDGKTWTREQLAGKVVALEFGKAPLAEKIAKERGMMLLQVQDDDTRRRFEVLTDPTVVVIDSRGNVAGFRAGPASDIEWRTEFDSGFGRGPNPVMLASPRQAEPAEPAGTKVTLAWEPVDNAESYIVEWDSRDEKGWIFDQDATVRVIATRDTSTTLDLTGFTRLRWRVYAVPRSGQPGKESAWREIEGTPVTKNYK
jgi:hypothetical protein